MRKRTVYNDSVSRPRFFAARRKLVRGRAYAGREAGEIRSRGAFSPKRTPPRPIDQHVDASGKLGAISAHFSHPFAHIPKSPKGPLPTHP